MRERSSEQITRNTRRATDATSAIQEHEGPERRVHLQPDRSQPREVLSSERYTSHFAAVNGIASVKENAKVEARFERRLAKDETLYFVLKAGNGEIVGTSETYTSSGAREQGIEAVRVNAAVACMTQLIHSEASYLSTIVGTCCGLGRDHRLYLSLR